MNYKNESGFTLVELLIVVFVIGALSAVLVSIINPSATQGRARDGVRLNNIKNISEGIEAYRQIEGSYPVNSAPANPNSTLMKTYIKKWPNALADDGAIDEDNYTYHYNKVGKGFVMYTKNSLGGCYKYQSDWAKVSTCPVSECSAAMSLASACN